MSDFFHERQTLGHCAVHALNNLLQRRWISYEECKAIAQRLQTTDREAGNVSYYALNGYQSALPYYGDFDIMVILEALGKMQLHVSDHITPPGPNRENGEVLSAEALSLLVGIIVNCPTYFMKIFPTRHWYAIGQINGRWVDLNSTLRKPHAFDSFKALNEYLRHCLESKGCQLFLVSTKEAVTGGGGEETGTAANAVAS